MGGELVVEELLQSIDPVERQAGKADQSANKDQPNKVPNQ
jgi:hypothetical protein